MPARAYPGLRDLWSHTQWQAIGGKASDSQSKVVRIGHLQKIKWNYWLTKSDPRLLEDWALLKQRIWDSRDEQIKFGYRILGFLSLTVSGIHQS